MSHTGLNFAKTLSTEHITVIWLNDFANPGSIGESFIDQIIASKTGPIGFMGAAPPSLPPNAATSLTVQILTAQ